MIKKISSLTGEIFLKTQFTDKNTGVELEVNKQYKNDTMTNNQILLLGVDVTDKINYVNGKVLLQLKYECILEDIKLGIYKVKEDELTNQDVFYNAAVECVQTENKKYEEIITLQKTNTGESNQVVFDITELVKKEDVTKSVILAIETNNTSSGLLTLYDPKKEEAYSEKGAIEGISYNDSGINNQFKYDIQEVGDTGKGYLNLYNGKLIHLFKGTSTLSKKDPIEYNYSYFYQDENNNLKKQIMQGCLTPNFYYEIIKESDYLFIIKDYTGKVTHYKVIKEENKDDEIKAYNIKHSTEEKYKECYICYNEIDQTYFYITENQDNEAVLYFYDKVDNMITINIKNQVGYIQTIKLKNKGIYTYTWQSETLTKISNSKNEYLSFTYDDTSLTSVYNSALKTTIKYTYSENSVEEIESKENTDDENNLQEEILRNIKIEYKEGLLSKITDKKVTGYSINYKNNPVTEVTIEDEDGIILDKKIYKYPRKRYTAIQYVNGLEEYYSFNLYGQLVGKINSLGESFTYNYDKYEDGRPKHLVGAFINPSVACNYIEDGSFEKENPFYTTGWYASCVTGQSEVKIINEGLRGEKCIYINKVANESPIFSCDINSTQTGTYEFTGLIKHDNQVIQGDIKASLTGTYKTSIGNFVINESIEIDSSKTNWQKFSISKIVPETANEVVMKLQIIFSGGAYVAYLDDVELSIDGIKYNTRHLNYISNGYMNVVSNNLPVSWEFENFTTEDKIINISSLLNDLSSGHPKILDNKFMMICPRSYSINNKNTKKMFQNITIKGLANEQLLFSVFALANVSDSTTFKAYVKITYQDETSKTYEFDFAKNNPNWQVLTRAIKTEDSYIGAEIGIEYDGCDYVYLDAFQLYKNLGVEYYNYQENGTISNIVASSGDNKVITYANNKVNKIKMSKGGYYKFYYDDEERLKQIKDAYNNLLTYEYDSDDNLIKVTLTTREGEELINTYTYDENGNVLTMTDENNQTITCTYNQYNQMVSEILPNGISTYKTYNQRFELEKISNSLSGTKNNEIIYYPNGLVKTLKNSNGINYNFEYNSTQQVSKIIVGNSDYNTFAYGKTINEIDQRWLLSKKYGNSGNCYSFEYDNNGNVIEVKCDNVTICEYEYNLDGTISIIYDTINKINHYLTYDTQGKLIKVVNDSNLTINYGYDNLNNLQTKIIKINNQIQKIDYEYPYEYQKYNIEAYFDEIDQRYKDEIITFDDSLNGRYGAVNDYTLPGIVEDEQLKMKVLNFDDKFDFASYDLSEFNSLRTGYDLNGQLFDYKKWKSSFSTNKTFYMWIKPSGTYSEQVILKLEDETNEKILFLNMTRDGKLGFKTKGEDYYLFTTSNYLNINKWNFIGFKMYQRATNAIKVLISLNGITTAVYTFYTVNLDKINTLYISDQTATGATTLDSSSVIVETIDYTMNYQIAMIGVGAYEYQEEDFAYLYKVGKPYFVDNLLVLPSSGVHYYNHNVYQDFEVMPLQGTINSSLNNYPTILKTKNKKDLFIYDITEDCNLYSSKDKILGYKLKLTNTGAITLKFKPLNTTIQNPLLSIYDRNNNKLEEISLLNNSLFINDVEKTNFFTLNTWNTITLFKNSENITSIYVNGNLTISFIDENNYSNSTIYLGSDLEGNLTFDGYLKMFAQTDKEYSQEEALNLALTIHYNGNEISVRSKYDLIGRKTKKTIKTNKTSFTINYNYHLNAIINETDSDGTNINYNYDKAGLITYKLDNDQLLPNAYNYFYDNQGQLTEQTNNETRVVTHYRYDNNGNITNKCQTNSANTIISNLTYKYVENRLTSIKDELTNKTTTYSYYLGNPTTITDENGNQVNLTWQGKRLMSYYDVANQFNLKYYYNEQGIRIRKVYSSSELIRTTNYEVEGSNILAVHNIYQGKSMYFHYDENNMLTGFNYDENEYVYLRDITGNINKIIDENGNLIVKYVYDAWGNHKVYDINGSERASEGFIGNINPFRYKGYYYDVETQLFWVSSRYYSPELCRFISPDDVDYLDPSSINGLNLYAYCMNDPINYADPSGHWVETVFDLFSLGVSIVEVIINPYDPLNWAGLAGDALDLIPFVTGVGETVRGVKVVAKGVDMADDVYDTIKIMKVADLTDDAWDTVRGLDRAGDFTQSTMSAGRRIHKGYKTFDIDGKEFRRFRGIRLDYFDEAGRLVYELKPYNINSLKAGVSQLARYRRRMGKGYTWILELY